MDVRTATQYMKLGYRVRREGWSYIVYVYDGSGLIFGFDGKQDFCLELNLSDLLADDWEIITEGIKTHFNKEGTVEYIE